MKRLYAAATLGVVVLLALAYWKNTFSYGFKTRMWRAGKSIVDAFLVLLAALYLPAMSVSWIVLWLTRGIKSRGLQITLAVLCGVLFGTVGGVALEVLCVLGIFAVDLLTGYLGIYGWMKTQIPDDFMPYLKERSSA